MDSVVDIHGRKRSVSDVVELTDVEEDELPQVFENSHRDRGQTSGSAR